MSSHAPHDDISSLLGADHEHLDQLFAEVQRLLAAGAPALAAFEPFALGLRSHMAVEERLLFPAFDRVVPMRGPTTVMTHEHRRIEELLVGAEAALRAADRERFDEAAAALVDQLRSHNMKEERVLYPRIDAALSPPARDALVNDLRRQLQEGLRAAQ